MKTTYALVLILLFFLLENGEGEEENFGVGWDGGFKEGGWEGRGRGWS